MAYQRILTIQDLSCLGQCSLGVALPILSACGHETAVLPTAVLSTHTGRFQGYTLRDLTDDIPGILRHWEEESLTFSAIYTGYLASARQVELVREVIRSRLEPGGLLIVDPAMADDGALYKGLDASLVEAMRALCAEADYVLPNLTEAALLSGFPYSHNLDETGLSRLAERVAGRAGQTVLLTGANFKGKKTGVFLWKNGEYKTIQHNKLPSGGFGTGDVFAAAFTGALVRWKPGAGAADFPAHFAAGPGARAAQFAADFTLRCVARTARGPEHWYGLEFEPELPWLMKRLEELG